MIIIIDKGDMRDGKQARRNARRGAAFRRVGILKLSGVALKHMQYSHSALYARLGGLELNRTRLLPNRKFSTHDFRSISLT